MTRNQAIQQAHDFINSMYDLGDDEIIILDDKSEETDETWIFAYDSRQYIETGDPLYMVQIEFPIVVNKQDGTCELKMGR